MVLESIVDPWSAKKHPIWIFFLGILFASIAIIFSLWIFRTQSSLVMVFLTVVLSLPLMYATLIEEEEEDERVTEESTMLKEHSKALIFLSTLFMGFVIGYALWYMFLPYTLTQHLFGVQLETIKAINSQIVALTGNAISWDMVTNTFMRILTNNVKVLIFCIFFSFFFGAGSIFILAWNASVISAAVGTYFHNALAGVTIDTGISKIALYFQLFFLSIMRYMTHGVFEILGYFLGALAGGIISVAIVNHGIESNKFKKVAYDACILGLIAFGFLIVGAFVEVLITPMLF